MKIGIAGLILVMAVTAVAQEPVKCEANLNGFRIHSVYIVGSQFNGVAWAYKHLAEATCMEPVTDPAKADAILEIVPAISAPQSTALTVTCQSSPGSTSCLDSDGNVMDVSCSGGYCSSYYGPSAGAAVLSGLGDWVRHAWYESNARLYTTDYRILWKSEGQKGERWFDLWPDLLREATFKSSCKVPSGKNGDRWRAFASEKCGIQFDPAVSIDLKLKMKRDAAAQDQSEKAQMVDNARQAAAAQRKQ